MTISNVSIYKTDNKKTYLKDIILSLLVFLLIIILLTNPKKYALTILDGLLLFSRSVLPGLFPFMFLTRILTNMNSVKLLSTKCNKLTNKLFSSPGIGAYTLLISQLSGYPVGAKIIGDLHSNNQITDIAAKRMLSYSMTSGPAFIVGTVGALMFESALIGIIILISHFASNIINGIIFSKLIIKDKNKKRYNNSSTLNLKTTNTDKILSDSMYSSVQSILIVGGFISVFYCFSAILTDIGLFSFIGWPISKLLEFIGISQNFTHGIMTGIIEVTSGCKEISLLYKSYPVISVSLSSALISFSGLCILFQSKAFLSGIKIKTRFLILLKSVHSIISYIICYIISCLML